tara:strand:+ start:61 stop:684 length:624 start_codon:yes stop_codon:yes gene_type:complete
MAKRSQLDMNRILKQISVEVPKSLEKFANREVRKKANAIKKEVLQQFDEHEVTKEIKKGPSGRSSSLLGGQGNFFGFLGFEKGSQPIVALREVLENSFNISSKKGRVVEVSKNIFRVEFDIMVPNKLDIYSVTPLPWTTKSWVQGVEKGITNYSQTVFQPRKGSGFLYDKYSRSGVALQTPRQINFIKFNPTPYIINILEKAKRKLK